jgi:micrococcal nuclease
VAKKSLVLLVLGLVGYAAAAGVPQPGSTAPSASSAPAWFTLRGKVTRVVDGDTIHVRIGVKSEKVRLIGIDSPEVGDCFSREATQAMRAMAQGNVVRLVGDRSQTRRDRYRRLLAYVILPSGVDAGRNLLVRGLADLYVTSPRFARYQAYAATASDASARAVGLHASCLGSPPPTTTAEPVNPPIAIPSTPTTTAPLPLAPPANCAASYPDVCIPPPPPDLDCGQVAHKRFRVIYTVASPDPHRFDGDRDGVGCES